MRCAKAKKLLYLMRPGELDEATKRKLSLHVEACPRCRAEWAEARSLEPTLEALRNVSPVNEDVGALTQSIMERVQAEQALRRRGQVRPLAIDTRLAWMKRMSYGTAWLIVGAFFILSYGDARKMEVLEARMGRVGDQQEVAALPGPPLAQGVMKHLDNPRSLQNAAAGIDIEGALAAIRSSALTGTTEMDRLRAKYPKLWSLKLDHGLDDSTRKILSTEGKAFLKDVQELVNLGER